MIRCPECGARISKPHRPEDCQKVKAKGRSVFDIVDPAAADDDVAAARTVVELRSKMITRAELVLEALRDQRGGRNVVMAALKARDCLEYCTDLAALATRYADAREKLAGILMPQNPADER